MNNKSFQRIGIGLLVLSVLLALGATQIKGSAGYAGAAPDFLPWVMTGAMALLGVIMVVTARRSQAEWVESPGFPPRWRAAAWVGAGLLLNAGLIEYLGFILSCALLFACAARGFRVGADERPTPRMAAQDFAIGAAISAPVFWMFTRLLGVTLPALVNGGWI